MRSLLHDLWTDDRGQDTVEYLLIVGGVAIIIVAALAAGFIVILPQILGRLCPAVDSVDPAAVGGCIGP